MLDVFLKLALCTNETKSFSKTISSGMAGGERLGLSPRGSSYCVLSKLSI